jgi:DNA-binding CsgD family transcriptional regulator
MGSVVQRPRELPAGLTERELEVLLILALGQPNREVAKDLGISAKTVGHHVQHIYEKAGVRSRAAATVWAFEQGLVRSRWGVHPMAPGRPGAYTPLTIGGERRRREQQRRREMMLTTTTVEDFDRWLKIFSTTSLEKRKHHGSKGSTVFRDPNEDDRVWVLFDWDEEGFQNFVSDPEVPAILKEAGHKGKPQAAELGGRYDA